VAALGIASQQPVGGAATAKASAAKDASADDVASRVAAKRDAELASASVITE
jgi:hypothetical protein